MKVPTPAPDPFSPHSFHYFVEHSTKHLHHPAENIIIPREYMELYGRTEFGVAVPGTEDFIGTLNVYHELHCIVSDTRLKPIHMQRGKQAANWRGRNEFISIPTRSTTIRTRPRPKRRPTACTKVSPN